MSKAAVATNRGSLPWLVRRAADALAGATSAAEVLDARDKATAAYDEAKRAARIQAARHAHDDVIAAVHRAQADALEIEAHAKRRLADEYDAAQQRGEVGKKGQRTDLVPAGNKVARAEDVGLSRKQVFESRQVRDAIERDPGIVRDALDELLARGDEPTRTALKRAIAPVAKTIRSDEQAAKKERRQAREVELAARQTALPQKKYGIISADPEWRFEPYSLETGMDRAADNHYPTSDLLTLMRRDVGAIADKDCILFLWATVPMLIEAICVLDAWGFAWIDRDPSTGFLAPNKARCRYVSHFAWLKQKLAPGYWNRGKHEILLIATRGNPVAPAMGDQLESWLDDGAAIAADATKHSKKPDSFAGWIEQHWPNTPKIELNARRARPGWDVWGNEAEEAGGPDDESQTPAGERIRSAQGDAMEASQVTGQPPVGEASPSEQEAGESKRGFRDALRDWTEFNRLKARAATGELSADEVARLEELEPVVKADLEPVPDATPSVASGDISPSSGERASRRRDRKVVPE